MTKIDLMFGFSFPNGDGDPISFQLGGSIPLDAFAPPRSLPRKGARRSKKKKRRPLLPSAEEE